MEDSIRISNFQLLFHRLITLVISLLIKGISASKDIARNKVVLAIPKKLIIGV